MHRILFCAAFVSHFAGAQTFPFTLAQSGETIAVIEMTAPGADWSVAGREASMAQLSVDDRDPLHVMLFAGAESFRYRVLLGRLSSGAHQLTVTRNAIYSAKDIAVQVKGAQFEQADSVAVRHAPMLYERKTALGHFTDIPLAMYCEQKQTGTDNTLEYTVIFSNEDGGTSTRGLMARWGRTTDIEYVYRVTVDAQGSRKSAMIQGRGHNDAVFTGPFEGDHPLLVPVTQNNMVAGEGPTPVRYNPVPVVVDLSKSSRETVMDQTPITWRVMAQELIRENKLRPAGAVDGERISDPRNYLFIEAKIRNQRSRAAAVVKLTGKPTWYTANLGRTDLAIERDGWVRTTVELPPGTKANQIAEVGFQCLAADREKDAGICEVLEISKMFLLTEAILPGPSFYKQTQPVTIPSGQVHTWTLK